MLDGCILGEIIALDRPSITSQSQKLEQGLDLSVANIYALLFALFDSLLSGELDGVGELDIVTPLNFVHMLLEKLVFGFRETLQLFMHFLELFEDGQSDGLVLELLSLVGVDFDRSGLLLLRQVLDLVLRPLDVFLVDG